MKIQYASDLHLEFSGNSKYLVENPFPIVGDYLILAGDITYFNEEYFKDTFFDRVSKDFKEVYIIPGNHEYFYGFDIGQHEEPFIKSIRHNVHYLNNRVQPIDGVDFFFSTLWSKLDPQYIPFIKNGMNDFYKIIHKSEKFTTAGYERLHANAVQFLEEALKNSKAKKKVIVTHHIPTTLCNPDKYTGNMLNSAYVNSMGEFIEKHQPDYWVYGHHHWNLPMEELGKTRLVTNQLGYVHLGECKGFHSGAWFEV